MKRRGFILILAIFFIALIEMMALSVAFSVPQGVRGSVRYEEEIAAQLAADAGIQETILWIEKRLGGELEPTDPDHPTRPRTGRLGEFEWKVTIQPDAETYPRGNHSCRCYELVAEAWRGSYKHRRRVAISQQPFTKYARFNDTWPDPSTDPDGLYYWAGRIFVDGPVHSNDALYIMAEQSFYDRNEKYSILFDTKEVSAAGPVHYYNGEPTAAQRAMLFLSGKSPKTVERIPMPSMGNLKRQAWEGTPTATLDGLYARPNGGIYVKGDVDELLLDVDTVTGHAVQRFRIGADQYVVRERADGAMIRKPDGSTESVNKRNGLVYVDGSIRSLRGRNVGEHTIAVNPAAQNDIVLTGNLTGGRLGIVTYHLSMPSNSVLARDFNNPTQLEAAVYAVGHDGNGGMQVHERSVPVNLVGVLEIKGCLIEGRRRRCADVGLNSGWNVQVTYVPSLRKNPPPFFPALPRVEVLAVRQQ
jgi:hypothetical protein